MIGTGKRLASQAILGAKTCRDLAKNDGGTSNEEKVQTWRVCKRYQNDWSNSAGKPASHERSDISALDKHDNYIYTGCTQVASYYHHGFPIQNAMTP